MNAQPRYGDLLAAIGAQQRQIKALEEWRRTVLLREAEGRKQLGEDAFGRDSLVDKWRIKMRTIAEAVAIENGLTFHDLIGSDRKRRVSQPRQRAFLLCHMAGFSYPQIGIFFGNRDHTTVIHGVREAEKRERVDTSQNEQDPPVRAGLDFPW